MQDPTTFVEEQQYVVEQLRDAFVVGPITFAFPGYCLLLIFVGRNGDMFL